MLSSRVVGYRLRARPPYILSYRLLVREVLKAPLHQEADYRSGLTAARADSHKRP